MDWDGKCYLFHVPSIYPGKKTEVKSILITKDVKTRVREGYTGAENGMCFSWRNKGWRDAVFIYNIPESFKAFCNIVSLMAANTRRILEVSVACVKLNKLFFFFFQTKKKTKKTVSYTSLGLFHTVLVSHHSLWINIQLGPVHLTKPP